VANDWIKVVGLEGFASSYSRELSGGMRKRVDLARVYMNNPEAMHTDEPFAALDAMTRKASRTNWRGWRARRAPPSSSSRTDFEEAIYRGDRVIAMRPNPGRIADTFEVALARPRDQLGTREQPKFLRRRCELFDFIQGSEP
jgi:NitT/TauT family transport system ATP-binding protein